MEGQERRRCGAIGLPDGSVEWRVWAPETKSLHLVLFQEDQRPTFPMKADGRGYFMLALPNITEGQRYAFHLDGGPERPDPCSLWQPEGVHGPSAVVRPERFAWTDQGWRGVAREDLVFYELHTGTFTPEGTFEAMIPRLAELRDLGVTALELMPVGQFPGMRNWGYDGVGLYAAQNSYGGPHGLQRFVDACHAAGLAVFLDVVYNHLGPEGNYLGEFGPYFTDRYKTPWGPAVNYDGPGCDSVREFVLDNARMWLEAFHFDGLRLDAVHAIIDLGVRHVLGAIKEMADTIAQRTGRLIHIVAESDMNDPRLLLPSERGGQNLDSLWADDFHHAVHAFLTGERLGYYQDYGPADQLGRVLGDPFLYAGEYSSHRRRKHGAPPPPDLAGDRFIVCGQNHDQVGNRARGERLNVLLGSPAKQRLAASLLLLSPYTPLLFMGEEYGEENPFPFFCSFSDPNLIEAVREGRKREFGAMGWQGGVLDPHAEDTFTAAHLRWSWPAGTPQARLRQLYRDLLTARREWPALRDRTRQPASRLPNPEAHPVVELVRECPQDKSRLRIIFNLSDQTEPLENGQAQVQKLLFTSENTVYGGLRGQGEPVTSLAPFECLVFGPPSWPAFP